MSISTILQSMLEGDIEIKSILKVSNFRKLISDSIKSKAREKK